MADDFYKTPLIEAARRAKLKYVKIFIEEEGEDVNTEEQIIGAPKTDKCYDENKTTALHEASNNGHLEVVRYLLQKGAHICGYWPHTSIQTERLTPLTLAAQHGHTEVVRCLLDKGANVDGGHYNYALPPLDFAIGGEHIDVVRVLLHKKAKLNYSGLNALYRAVQVGSLELVSLFLECGSNINERCKKSGLSPLSQAISANYIKLVAYLLKMGANYDQQDFKTRYLPLQSAIQVSAHCKESVEILLEFVKKRDGFSGMVKYLNNKDNLYGKTTLHLAFRAYAKSPNILNQLLIKSLLAYGADPSVKDDFGREPYHWEYIRNGEIRERLMAFIRDVGQ